MKKLFYLVTVIVALVFIISACCIDSESNIFYVTSVVSGIFMAIEVATFLIIAKKKNIDIWEDNEE